jgi:hypothetical protein
MDAVRSLEENARILGTHECSRNLAPLFAFSRYKAEKSETRGRQPTDGKRSYYGAGAGHGADLNPRCSARGRQRSTGVRDPGGAGVAHQSHAAALAQQPNQLRCTLLPVVLMMRHQSFGFDAQQPEKFGRVPRILGTNYVDTRQNLNRAERYVLQISQWCGHKVNLT